MDLLQPANIKIIHWELTITNRDDIFTKESSVDLKGGKRFNSETHNQTGFYFRWTVRIYTPKGLFVSCIAEDSYKIEDVSLLTVSDMRFLIERSHATFEVEFNKRLNEETNDFPIPLLFVWSDSKIADILLELI